MDILIDAGPIIAFFNKSDRYHYQVTEFFCQFTGGLITTCPVVTEALWQLRGNSTVQYELLLDLEKEIYHLEPLIPSDLKRIAELHKKYSDRPADFADLSLIAISERLNLAGILTFDQDFDIYRRYKKQFFDRILLLE